MVSRVFLLRSMFGSVTAVREEVRRRGGSVSMSTVSKVLKALAEYFDITLGDLLEGIVLHAFDGKCAFTEEETLQRIAELKKIYGVKYDSSASHRFIEQESDSSE